MNHNYLIGLGGSGGKIIAQLYGRLIKERGSNFEKEATCVAIDTDRGELNDLAQLGVKQVCISGSGNVGQFFNNLGDDVSEWCPNTANEGNFFSSQLFNGASQCRLKSRLCLANFLKDNNNTLANILEESLIPGSNVDTDAGEAPITVIIASSIAGGTGSGIFIQVALYIKKFFREHNIENVKIRGLFACPDLYKKVVPPQQLPTLYANAYAVVRELNAFNLICGSETTAAYGGKLDIDIEISTSCEGKLFEKDAQGRYGDKPYDTLYFIDRVNYLSKILGGLPEYYKAMANIAYSLLYTDISERVDSNESNEMNAQNIAPGAVYASAGASSVVYPYEDIMRYFANRSIAESFDSVWTVLDKEWANYCKAKDADARAKGMSGYVPATGEREEQYILDFDKLVKPAALTKNEMSFLAPMVSRGEGSVVEELFTLIDESALAEIKNDARILQAKTYHRISDLEKTRLSILSKIENATSDDKSDGSIFKQVKDIDDNLEAYCKKCVGYVADMSISFANNIFCDDKELWASYDNESGYGIIKNLLCRTKDDGTAEWIHPVAARYLLYSFAQELKKKIAALKETVDTPGDDMDDYFNYLVNQIVKPHKTALSTNEDNMLPNAKVLQKKMEKLVGSKKAAKTGVINYFTKLNMELTRADRVLADALLYFSYSQVCERIEKLISEYEVFFDNIGDFVKKANSAVTSCETMHDNGRGVLYVCAGADIKRSMYDEISKHINLKTGDTASIISHALFDSMREKATSGGKMSVAARNAGAVSFFGKVSDIVTEASKNSTEINGSVDKNVFEAMLYEYSLRDPEHAEDTQNYSKDDGAKNRVDMFISAKLDGVSKQAAPLLVYDSKDTYSGMFTTVKDGETKTKSSVTNTYRYISNNDEVAESICSLMGSPVSGGAVSGFYGGFISDLPKDTENQSIYLSYVNSDKVDRYTMLFYSTVHCLQPYQIKAFDEMHGGIYYENYSKRILEMEKIQRYSMTPHLDKRWHKHGTMPYVNVAKEIERRLDLAKAFLYALCYGKIGYYIDGSNTSIVYSDMKLDSPAEIIFYKGKSVPYERINEAMCWLADREDLIEGYSAQFDRLIEAEIDALSKYGSTVGGYKSGITNYARILNQLKKKIIRPIELVGAKNGKAKKEKTLEAMCIFDLAWNLHVSEENKMDKDYAELLIETLCGILKKYCKAPFNAEDIARKAEGSEAYINYKDVLEHVVNSFKEEYAAALSKKRKEELILDDEDETMPEEEEASKASFGRSTDDLVDEDVAPVRRAVKGESVLRDKRMQWVNACIGNLLANE